MKPNIYYVMLENIDNEVMSSQVFSFLQCLKELGHENVELIALTKRSSGVRDLRNIRFPTKLYRNYGARDVRTYLNIMRLMFYLWIVNLFRKNNVIIFRNVHTGILLYVLMLILSNRKYVLDLRGAFVEEISLRGIIKSDNKRLIQVIRFVEKKVYKKVSKIFCVSNVLEKYVYEQVKDAGQVEVVPCCVSAEMKRYSNDCDAIVKRREDLGVKADEILFVYAGSLNRWNVPHLMIEMFERLVRLGIKGKFLILTKDVDEILKLLKNKYPLNRSKYLIRSVKHEDVDGYLRAADVGFLVREKNKVNEVACPVKFAEYLCCGVPVIITKYVGDLEDLVRNNDIGIVIEDCDLEKVDLNQLKQSILYIKTNRGAYMKKCMEFAFNYFDRNNYLHKYDFK